MSGPPMSETTRRAVEWYHQQQARAYTQPTPTFGAAPRLFEQEETLLSLDACEALRRRAWDAPYERQASPTFEPLLGGDCKSKAAWLQRSGLRGTIMTGRRTDGGDERHAVLLFARQGKLFVADFDRIWPLADHPFWIEGFVRAAWPDEDLATLKPVKAAPPPD